MKIKIPSAHGGGMNVHRGMKRPPTMVFARLPVEPTGQRKKNGVYFDSTSLSEVIRREEWQEAGDIRRATEVRDRERRRVLSILNEQALDAERLVNAPPARNCTPGTCTGCTPRRETFKPLATPRLIEGDARHTLTVDTPASAAGSASSAPPRTVMQAGDTPLVSLATDLSATETTLRAHLKTAPDDYRAMRHLAMAELCIRRPADAARTMAVAYAADPLLAGEPIELEVVGLDAPTGKQLAGLAQANATKVNTADAWLLLVVVRQAQGQTQQALGACDKAEKAGLDPSLAGVFRHRLTK